MFKYPLKYADALSSYLKYTTGELDAVEFTDPALNQFYADEAQGLCRIELLAPDFAIAAMDGDSVLEIHYTDPELEFERRLQA